MKKSKIEKEDIISDEAIKNVNRLNFEIDKLDKKLEGLAKKYNIPQKKVWEMLQSGIIPIK